MNIEKHTVEGITLHAIDFKEYDRIITVFSKEMGIISLIVKGANRKKKGVPSALATPLSCGEFIFSAGKSNLFAYRDGTIYDQFISLRNDFDTLNAANTMLVIIQNTILPGKPAPLLYSMLKKFLFALAFFKTPENFLASFRLKTLCHEGLLSLDPEATYNEGNIFFDEEERTLIFCLAASRSLEQLSTLFVAPETAKKIALLFEYVLASQ